LEVDDVLAAGSLAWASGFGGNWNIH
jgi:hypothetical protein